MRVHDEKPRLDVNTCNPCYHHDFEFAFVTEPEVLVTRYESGCTQHARPATSAGEHYKSKRKPELTLLIERPNTSHSSLLGAKSPTVQIDESQIGVAFGSPRHPPRMFEKTTAVMSPLQSGQGLCSSEPVSNQRSKIGRWRIKNLFRSKNKQTRNSYSQHRQSRDISSQPCKPKKKTPKRKTKSPLSQIDPKSMPTSTNVDVVQQDLSPNSTEQQAKILLASSLQSKEPEKFSIKHHQTDNGAINPNQSRLMVRRSKVFSQLLIKEESIAANNQNSMPDLLRPATSPTMTRPFQYERSCGSTGSVGRYSLFPPTPTLDKSPPRIGSPMPMRRRSSTAPSSSISPVNVAKTTDNEPLPYNIGLGKPPLLPSIDSSDILKPITFQHFSHDSHASSQSDIFFEVKSFRDSSGQDGQHYEMTRPPSAAVQLARSKSSARKQQDSSGNPILKGQHSESNPSTKSTPERMNETVTVLEALPSSNSQEVKAKTPASASGGNIAKHSEPQPMNNKTSTSVHDTTTRSSSPPPPPVPIKDSRFIPSSKRAQSQTIKAPVCKSCTRPVRAKRANTDTCIRPSAGCLNTLQHQPPARAATVPLPKAPCAPLSKYAVPPTVTRPTPEPTGKSVDSVIAANVKPAAEVSVARTISLSRRPSAKVVHPARKPSKREPKKEDVTEKKVNLNVPVLQRGERKHKPGLSLDVVLETATIAPSSPPPVPSPNPDAKI